MNSGSSAGARSLRYFVRHHHGIIVALLCLILAIGLRIDRVLLNTFPTGGDNGGHLGMPAYVRRVLAPQWRITGWSNDWFAGVPILALYFPLPAWLIIALDTVLPYSVSYKLITIVGTVLLPWATWRLGRKASLPSPAPLFLAMATLPFLLNRSYRILGGNVLSTMAGEFSFSLSLLFCVLFLGSMLDVIRHGRQQARAALLLTATGLCHIVPTMFAVVAAAAFVVFFSEKGQRRAQYKRVLTVGAAGGLLAAFWIVPFASLLPYTNSMDYERNTLFRNSLFPFLPGKHTLHVLADGGALIAGGCILALVALVWAVLRRSRFVAAIATTGAAMALGFLIWPTGSMWNNRLLPLWFFAIFLLAGVGAAALVRRWSNRPGVAAITGVAILITSLAPAFAVLPGWFPLPVHGKQGWRFQPLRENRDYRSADLPFAWAATNAEGMQRKKAWPEFRALMTTLQSLPCGRMFWERDKGYVRFGSSMAMMGIPFFTKSCIQSVEGLYFESTQTTPFSFITSSLVSDAPSNPQRDLRYGTFDLDKGVDRVRRLGARYLMGSSEKFKTAASKRTDLREVARSGSFAIYELTDFAIVVPLTEEPVVVNGAGTGLDGGFLDLGLAQWADTASFPDTYVTSGPASWPRAELRIMRTRGTGKLRDTRGTGVTLRPTRPAERPPLHRVTVTDVDLQPTSIAFTVDKPGVPVLVRMSWAPGWEVTGAATIRRASPNFIVVVPTGRNVRITMARTGAEHLGNALSLVGLLGVAALAVGDRRRRRNGATEALSPDGAERPVEPEELTSESSTVPHDEAQATALPDREPTE